MLLIKGLTCVPLSVTCVAYSRYGGRRINSNRLSFGVTWALLAGSEIPRTSQRTKFAENLFQVLR